VIIIRPNGTPNGYQDLANSPVKKQRFYCSECGCNWKSDSNICPNCEAEAKTPEQLRSEDQLKYSPKAMVSKTDEMGNPLDPAPVRKKVKIELDFQNERKIKDLRKLNKK